MLALIVSIKNKEKCEDLTVHTFNYSHKCFPRWNRLVRNLKFYVPPEHKVDVVCRADHAINKSDFALETDDEGKESFNELKPSTVFVGILQCDKNGSLKEQDRHLLDYFKSHIFYAHQHDQERRIFNPFVVVANTEDALFVIDGTLTDMELCRVSEEINEHMKFEKNHNYVLHRMFLKNQMKLVFEYLCFLKNIQLNG
ncbi:unnamed protein product [Mytilus edulis]|uniref:Uncharacterized protein n=1 Tax=Mytilus edulis TaxID=6550 RepID=A0A8S3UIU0_MYTED|nr:unnamed protein product [Mytilus edulis]